MINRIEHANIAVQDIDEMIQFLTAAFPEFKMRGDGMTFNGDSRWAHVGSDNTYLALVEVGPGSAIRIPYCDTPGLNHLGFEVDDVGALRERLLTAGYQESTVPNAHPHRTRIYFHDREGNDWEFVEYHSDDTELRNDYQLPDL